MQQISISKLKTNDSNPRTIRDANYKKLLQSLTDFPEMLHARPIVVDENYVVLGGNMRLRALRELKVDKAPVIQIKNFTEEQKKEFLIKDNASLGDWDYDILANDWDAGQINDWGLNVWNPQDNSSEEFSPNITPSSDKSAISDEEIQKAQEGKSEKLRGTEVRTLQCICPECAHQFEAEIG